MTLYLLPGVGCDKRLFERLILPGIDVVYLDWPPFPKGCTLKELAAAMRPAIDETRPHVLGGVSLGGMVAQELAMLTKPQKIILISTWTDPREYPILDRLAGMFGLTWIIGSFTMWATWPLKRILGQRDRKTDRLLWDMAKEQTATKIRHGVEAVLRWKGSRWKGPVARIHGSNDHVIPLRFPVDQIVVGGAHIMVLNRSQEISDFIIAAMPE